METGYERSNNEILPFYSVIDLIKIILTKFQESEIYRCEIEQLQYEYSVLQGKQLVKVPYIEVKREKKGILLVDHIGVRVEDYKREVLESNIRFQRSAIL